VPGITPPSVLSLAPVWPARPDSISIPLGDLDLAVAVEIAGAAFQTYRTQSATLNLRKAWPDHSRGPAGRVPSGRGVVPAWAWRTAPHGREARAPGLWRRASRVDENARLSATPGGARSVYGSVTEGNGRGNLQGADWWCVGVTPDDAPAGGRKRDQPEQEEGHA